MVGDLFFTEPVGRIVRRAKVVVTDGLTQLKNAYPQSEFLRSTDPLFRPVAITNAPDGSLYLMDMYTGIIQDAQFVGPNSYLRRKVEQLALDKQHNWGRIWRITYEGTTPDRQRPQMYRDTPAQLVQAPRACQRLVARHGAEGARAAPGQVRRAGARRRWRGPRATSWRRSTRSGRSKASARSTRRSSAS